MLYRPGPRTFYINDALLPRPPKGSHDVPNVSSGCQTNKLAQWHDRKQLRFSDLDRLFLN